MKSNKIITTNQTYKSNEILKMKYNDLELNELIYNEALKIDKRNFLEYYLSLLKTKHLIIFTFYTNNDYNSKIIKISLFFFNFSLYFAINGLFFTDPTIHKIYENKGTFNFIYQIPKIMYSTMINSLIYNLISYLSISERNIIKTKKKIKKFTKINKKEFDKMVACLKTKFFLYFLFNFIFLEMFWFYIGCFCTIYRNTQLHLIKDSLISFGFSLVYPFFLIYYLEFLEFLL